MSSASCTGEFSDDQRVSHGLYIHTAVLASARLAPPSEIGGGPGGLRLAVPTSAFGPGRATAIAMWAAFSCFKNNKYSR